MSIMNLGTFAVTGTKGRNASGLSIYEATRALQGANGLRYDGASVRRESDGVRVAYFCDHDRKVKATVFARPAEIDQFF